MPRNIVLAACVVACAVAAAMPSRSELKKVQGLVNELMAGDIQAMKAGRLKAPQVAANAEKLAGDAEGEAAKFLLYKGAFGLYVQGGAYDEAIRAIDRLRAAVKDVPDKVVAEILREKLKRIPKKNGSAIFNLYDGICRRMAAAEERGKLEKSLKASPGDSQTRRLLAVRCAQMDDWKAANEHFAALGGKEAAAVKAESSDAAEAADFWWGYQPGVEGADDDPFRRHAAMLYRKAIDQGRLPGLKLMLAKKRVAEAMGEQGDGAQAGEPVADAKPAKAESAEKPLREEPKPAARVGGGRRVDWSLPKNFKGSRSLEFDLGDGRPMRFLAVPPGSAVFKADGGMNMPMHDIRVTRPFWFSQFPVSSHQVRLSGVDVRPGIFDEKFADDEDAIILAHVRAEGAENYFRWLNEKFGASLPKGMVFRPPTQGETCRIREAARQGVYNARWIGGPNSFGQWLDHVHAKGMLTECKTFEDARTVGNRLGFSSAALLVGVSKLRKDKNLIAYPVRPYFSLDRVSVPNVDDRLPFKEINAPNTVAQILKALDFRQIETDPFRYVADGEPRTWVPYYTAWMPRERKPSFYVQVVVGHDYVGEWKAKNGK